MNCGRTVLELLKYSREEEEASLQEQPLSTEQGGPPFTISFWVRSALLFPFKVNHLLGMSVCPCPHGDPSMVMNSA